MKLSLFVMLPVTVLLSPVHSNAQWVQTNGPYGGSITCFAVSGTNLFAGTHGGVFLSTNNGASWTAVNTGLTNPEVRALAVSGTNLLAGTYGAAFLSTNNGTSWTPASTGLPYNRVFALAVSGMNLFAGGGSGSVFLSTNNGTSWTAVNNGLTNLSVQAFAISGTRMFAGTAGGVWRRPLSEMIFTDVESAGQVPSFFRLEQNYPNPFNPSTTIGYSLPHSSHVKLTVSNILGQEVAILVNGGETPGYKAVEVDASNLASGVYLYRLQAGEFVAAKKLVLVR